MPPTASSLPGPGLLGRDFVLLLAATFGALSNYAPLLSVVPLWASTGGSGGTGVGATTGVIMAATVLTQLSMGRLLRLFTLRQMLALGAGLMGAVTPGYLLSSSLVPVLTVSALRGVGFGMVVVAGSALVAELLESRQWGKGVGVYGLAAGLPGVVCLPLGVWAAQEVGFAPVFVATALFSLAAVPLATAMSDHREAPDREAVEEPEAHHTGLGGGTHVDLRPLAAPWILLLASAIALGGVATFLPLALSAPEAASLALFTLSACMILGRWVAGAIGDVVGSGRILLASVTTGATGMAGLAVAVGSVAAAPVLAPVAAAVYGLGFGAVQNDTLVVMLRRAGANGHGVASTVWNIAYDAGTGVGAVLLGAVVAWFGHTWAFAVAAVAIAAVTPAAWLESQRAR